MSGGVLTDYCHNLHYLKEWAERLQDLNGVLAEQMRDMYELLEKYDLFLSDDLGPLELSEAWTEYYNKWVGPRQC
jgi:hypothetical protein